MYFSRSALLCERLHTGPSFFGTVATTDILLNRKAAINPVSYPKRGMTKARRSGIVALLLQAAAEQPKLGSNQVEHFRRAHPVGSGRGIAPEAGVKENPMRNAGLLALAAVLAVLLASFTPAVWTSAAPDEPTL